MQHFTGTILGVLGFAITTLVLTHLVSLRVPDLPATVQPEIINHLDSLRHSYEMYTSLEIDETKHILTSRNLYFNSNPSFLLWVVLISISVALSLALLPWLWAILTVRLRDKKVPVNLKLSFALAFLACLVVFTFSHFQVGGLMAGPPDIMAHANVLFLDKGRAVLLTLVSLVFLAPMFSLAGNFAIMYKLREELLSSDTLFSTKQIIRFKGAFTQLLMASSLMLVMGIITASLLRESVIGAVGGMAYEVVFPAEFVLAYGAIFTFFLVLFYAPVFLMLDMVIKKHLKSNSKKGKNGLLSIHSFGESVEVFITILAPVASSILLEWII